jgi:putative ABC transport system permease protein
MSWLKVVIARMSALLGREKVLGDIEDEFRSHIEIETEANMKRGLPPEEARSVALGNFGNQTAIKEAAYEVRGGGLAESLWQDLRFGCRLLLRDPGFTSVAIVTLALGIGANSAIFSVINSVLLRPLPFKEPEQLVAVWRTSFETSSWHVQSRQSATRGVFSYPDFLDFRDQDRLFDQMSVYRTGGFALTGKGEATRVPAAVVSANIFKLLGARPVLGRDFEQSDDLPDDGLKVILSNQLWQSRFGGDPGILGQTLMLTNRSYTVVGVMPAGFEFPIQADPIEVWATIASDAQRTGNGPANTEQRGNDYLNVIARLKPNTPIEQAQAEMATIASGIESEHPQEDTGAGVRLVSEHEDMVGEVRPVLLVLLGAVAAVLLVACANITSLQLARAAGRLRDVAIRSALGAGRLRIMRQLLTESLLLASAGGAAGLGLGLVGTRALVRLSPRNIPRLAETGVDMRVLGFTLAVSIVTGIIFGIAPAWQAARVNLSESLKEGVRAGNDGKGRNRFRSGLVAAQVAVGFVLLTGAGLLIRTLWNLQHIDPGFNPRNVLTFVVSLPSVRYSSDQQAEFYDRLLDRISSLPGVKSASAVFPLPLTQNTVDVSFEIEGRPFPKGQEPLTQYRWARPGYFGTMGIPLAKGRDFETADDQKSRPVIIINETLARQFFPDENPIGKRIRPGISLNGTNPVMREIVGVVGAVKHGGLTRESDPEVYVPARQIPFSAMAIVANVETGPESVVAAARGEVRALDMELPVGLARPMDDYVAASISRPRFNTVLLSIFAGLALILTAIGLYGVLAYAVAQRRHEIGVRMALGAKSLDLVGSIIGHGMGLTLIGLIIGGGGALALTRLMASLLFGISPTDAWTLIGVAGVLGCVALLASFIPAFRAASVDPIIELRCE